MFSGQSHREPAMYRSFAMMSSCLLIAGTSFISSGCSVLGYRLGAALDGGEPGRSVQVQEINASIPWDAKVIVLMKDSSTAKGGYRGIAQIVDTIQTAQYDVEFEKWRLQEGGDSTWNLPFGTSIQVKVRVEAGKDLYAGRFAGFDRGLLRLSRPPSGKIVPLKLDFVQHVSDSLGNVIATHDAIIRVIADGAPLASRVDSLGIRVELTPSIVLDGSRPSVPLNKVQSVNLLEPGDGKWIGLGIGIAADLAMIAAISTIHFDMNLGSR
jgi:hypothetical protein